MRSMVEGGKPWKAGLAPRPTPSTVPLCGPVPLPVNGEDL